MSLTPQLNQDFERLIRAFESIAKLLSNLQVQETAGEGEQ